MFDRLCHRTVLDDHCVCVSSAYSECNVIYKLLTVSVVRVTGSEVVDQIFTVLLSTSMFVGGVTGFILDTSVPGNRSLAVGRSHTHTHARTHARTHTHTHTHAALRW